MEQNVPLNFGTTTVYMKVIICDATLPLLSTNGLINQGLSVLLDQHEPNVKVKCIKHKFLYRDRHFWLKQKNNDEGIFGVTTKQHDKLMLPSSPEQENSTNFQPKTQTSINRDYFNGIESNDLNVFDNSNKYNISHEANHERNHAKPTLLPGQAASSASKQPPKNIENNQKNVHG